MQIVRRGTCPSTLKNGGVGAPPDYLAPAPLLHIFSLLYIVCDLLQSDLAIYHNL